MKNNTNEKIQKEYANYVKLDELNLDFIDKEYYLVYNKKKNSYGLITKALGVSIDGMDTKPSKKIPDFNIVLEKHSYKKLNISESNIIYNKKLDKYFLVDLHDIVPLKEIEKKSLQQGKMN